MESILEDLNRKFVSRTPHMREIGAHITSVSASRGSMTLPALITDMPAGVVWVPANSGTNVVSELGATGGDTVRVSVGRAS